MLEEKLGEGASAVTPAEMAQIFAPPAPYVNRFFVTGSGAHVRISFAEQRFIDGADSVMHVRAAVVLDTAEVIALRDLLTKLAESITSVDLGEISGG